MDALAARTQAIHDLEVKYQEASHRVALTVKDENARRVRVGGHKLRDEIAVLKEQLAANEDHIGGLNSVVDQVRSRLDGAEQNRHRRDRLIQAQIRDISKLREELSFMANTTKDSTKLLTDKLALSRELDMLKPEVEHLRSQIAQQKNVLAEKLALERQMNALEVELANEKRAAQKAAQKRQDRAQDEREEVEEDLQRQVRDLEKQLAKEQRTTQQVQEDRDKKIAKLGVEMQVLSGRLAEAEKKLEAERSAAVQAHRLQQQESAEAVGIIIQLKREAVEAEKEMDQLRKELAGRTADSALEEEIANLREKLEEATKARAQELDDNRTRDAEEPAAQVEKELDETKTKLGQTCKQLKQCRTELAEARKEMGRERASLQDELAKAREQAAKAAQNTLITTTTVPTKKPAAARASKAKKEPAARGRKKRRAEEMDDAAETILHTPNKAVADEGKAKRYLKRGGVELAHVGEKSTFSITPFLNKTINLSDMSVIGASDDSNATKTLPVFHFRGVNDEPTTTAPMAADSEPTAENPVPVEEVPVVASPDPVPAATKPSRQLKERKPRALKAAAGSAPPTKKATGRPRKAPRVELTLERVMEEEADEERPAGDGPENLSASSDAPTKQNVTIVAAEGAVSSLAGFTGLATTAAATVTTAEPKKKRRLLGSSGNRSALLEEDNNEDEENEQVHERKKRPMTTAGAGAGVAGAAAGALKRVATKTTAAVGGGKQPPIVKGVMGAKKPHYPVAFGGLGKAAFSPLKRDRRGLTASFLG